MTPCDRIEALLPAYVDGELDAEAKAAVESHLAGCRACASLAAALASVGEALAAFPEIEPTPTLTDRLRAVPRRHRLRIRPVLDVLLRPAFQPLIAAATVLAVAFTLFMASPDKKAIERAVTRQLHRGFTAFEKLTAKAGAAADSLGATAGSVYASIQTLNPLGKSDKNAQ
jgi:anti-sigma factor RsiW